MLKRLTLIIIVLFSISFMSISNTSALEASVKDIKSDTNYNYYDLLKIISFLKSLRVYYYPHLYPDIIYFGPSHTLLNHQDPFIFTEKNSSLDTILFDLKWQLHKGWFLGIYSELEYKEKNRNNIFNMQIKDPLDTDFGIVVIRKF